jgi:hypothetical protein
MTEVQRITKRVDLVALKNALGVPNSWHEPDEQLVTAQVRGGVLGNAGNWGEAALKDRWTDDDHLELWVTLSQDGTPVAEVNLAVLLSFATGHAGD